MIDPLSQTINAPHRGQFIVMLLPNIIISLSRLKLLSQWVIVDYVLYSST